MTEQIRESENAQFVRALKGMGLGLVAGAATFLGPFGIPASWNGAIGRFTDAHVVFGLLLFCGMVAFGCIPVMVGVLTLVNPKQSRSTYSGVDKAGARVRTGERTYEHRRADSMRWIAFGAVCAAAIGFVFLLAAPRRRSSVTPIAPTAERPGP